MARDFTLNDFRQHLHQLRKLGKRNIKQVIDRLPEESRIIPDDEDPDVSIARIGRIIDAMTEEERKNPDIIDSNCRVRIAHSSGTEPSDVEEFLIQFGHLRTLMQQMFKMSLFERMKWMTELGKQQKQDEEE